MSEWPVEPIPDADLIYYRIHKSWLRKGDVLPGAFRDRGSAMSTDWMKYSTPLETRNRAKTPGDNAVISFVAGEARNLAALQVIHSPDTKTNNRAHTDITGEKDEEARLTLSRMMSWAIRMSDSAP